MALEISREQRGDAAMIKLTGELDLAVASAVERILALAEQTDPVAVIVDLSNVTFMDSSGLRLLVAADRRAHREGRRLELVPGPPQVMRLFAMTGLDSRLSFAEA